MVGCDGGERQSGEGEVEERGVGVLGVFFQRVEACVRPVVEVLFAGGDDAQEPRFAHAGAAIGAGGKVVEDVGEEDRDGLFGRVSREGARDIVAPELEAHGCDGGVGGRVGHAGDFEVEGADAEVGGLGGGRDKGEEGVGGGVVGSGAG